MKKLIFIDNDLIESAKEDSDYVKNNLEYRGKLPESYVDTMDLISQFSFIPKDDALKLLFDTNNCICTWSMYTHNHYNSLGQLYSFLIAAGRNDIRGIVYIDGSGKIENTLEREISNYYHEFKGLYSILNAIETNYIISFDDDKAYRLRIDLKGVHENPFRREDVDLNELLK
jgi:hypothetical protein